MKENHLFLKVIVLFIFLFLFSISSLALIPGDFGSAGGGPPDGVVDFEDLMIFAMAYGSTEGDANWNPACDIAGPDGSTTPDGVIDFEDLMIFAMHYGESSVHNLTKDKYYNTIQNALNDAQDGDIIEVAEQEFSESIIFPTGKAVILRNAIGALPIIIGLADTATVKFPDGCPEGTALEGFTITHNSGEGGRGIESAYNSSTITINGCAISGNSYGGIQNGGTMTINECTISGNSTIGCGGGILNGGALIINECTISDNSDAVAGGGIFNQIGTTTINGGTISGNSAFYDSSSSGGGIYNQSGTMNVNDCTISNNFASHHAGAIYNINGTMTINNCTISDNSAYSSGAIVNSLGSTLTINGGTISNNSTDFHGGGIYNHATTLTVEDCTISGNSARYGGGIFNYYEEGDFLTIKGCSITSNFSTQGSYFAGIYLRGLDSCEAIIIGGSEEVDKNTICGNYVTGNPPTLDDQIGNGTASLYDLYRDTNNIYDICP